jgi:hypothetical protein
VALAPTSAMNSRRLIVSPNVCTFLAYQRFARSATVARRIAVNIAKLPDLVKVSVLARRGSQGRNRSRSATCRFCAYSIPASRSRAVFSVLAPNANAQDRL